MNCGTRNNKILYIIPDITKIFLDDCLPDELYVHTKLHEEAKEKLLTKNLVVLTGHPGEGKTTMAMKLMLEVTTAEKCLKLAKPSDWRLVDFNNYEMVFVDDIFGPGVLEETLVKKWDKHLPEIWKAVKNKRIKLIVTTRHYILEGARQIFDRSSLFKEEHLQFLSSNNLSKDERRQMLVTHLQYKRKNTDPNPNLIQNCVDVSTSFLKNTLNEESSFLFGFPECVSMFVQNENLFESGPEFFGSPYAFFRKCIEEIRKDEKKFLALLMIWCKPGKVLFWNDLELSSTSEDIEHILEKFGFTLKGKLLKTLRMSLKHHTNGFLRYTASLGAYKFSHNVISDMVGLVISEDYPEACLDFADRDFVLEHVTIKNSKDTKICFFVEECLQKRLMETFIRLARIPSSAFSAMDELILKRGGHRPNEIHSYSKMDVGIFFHDSFSDKCFTRKFVQHLFQTEKLGMICEKPVMNMSGFFLSYGFKLQEMKIYLPSYTLFHGNGVLFMEMLNQDVLSTKENIEHLKDEIYLAMLISAHTNNVDVIKAILSKRFDVSEEAIYVAAIQENMEILKVLLNSSAKRITRCTFENDNNALIVASKLGLLDSVRLLARHTDLSLRNDGNVSALEKALLYQQEDVFKVLIEHGAPLNAKGGKFRRTPLHTAADMGLVVFVDMLLTAGARTDIKDHRGHYPIHCAAIRGEVDVVSKLVSHDPSQVKRRIASYGKSSKIKGMTVFHIAVWKKNKKVLKVLLDSSKDCNVQDWYGHTPLYRASFEGKRKLVEMLLPFSDVNQPDKHGYTPLHAAIHRGHGTVIQLLLPHSNVNAQDKFGCTPLHVACRKGYFDVVEELLELKADPHMVTKKGETVLKILLHNVHKIPVSSKELPSVNEPETDFTACVHSVYNHSPSFLEMNRS